MSYPYTIQSVPIVTNDPADDQPIMLANFNNIRGWEGVDHVEGGSSGAGFHEQVTYYTNNVPGSAPTNPVAVAFTNQGSASTNSQQFFANADATVMTSAIKAFGYFSIAGGTVTALNAYNLSLSYVSTTSNVATVAGTIATGATKSANYAVFISQSAGSGVGSPATPLINVTGTSTFNAFVWNGGGTQHFSIMILQY